MRLTDFLLDTWTIWLFIVLVIGGILVGIVEPNFGSPDDLP